VALLLAINRKIHRAYNRTRDSNYSLDGLIGFYLCSSFCTWLSRNSGCLGL
jgi:lactate dehydrogenase-like 2-hydroxyacid dehydrogenase